MRRILVLIAALAGVHAFAQTADLGLTKTSNGSSFAITVTNYGPSPAGSFVIEDSMPAPAQFSAQKIPAPWFCTPGTPSSTLKCTHPGPLKAGHSATLRLRYSAGSSDHDFVNCARVSHVVAQLDPNPANDRDCACVDVPHCADVVLDLTTGRENGANLPVNARDDDWMYVPATGPAAPSIVTTALAVPPPAGTPGGWIQPPISNTPSGKYTFRNTFTLADWWSENQCAIRLRFAADNSVAFLLDGRAVPDAVTPKDDRTTSAAFAKLTIVRIPLAGGTHTLTAEVTNISLGTGLFVHGEVICRCVTND